MIFNALKGCHSGKHAFEIELRYNRGYLLIDILPKTDVFEIREYDIPCCNFFVVLITLII